MVIMGADYLSQIENSQLKKRFLTVDNISLLEYLLDCESQRLKGLQKQKEIGKLNFGDKVSSDELKDLFPHICTEVDAFLGIQDVVVPRVGYPNIFKLGLVTTPALGGFILSISQLATTLLSPLFTEQNYVINKQFADEIALNTIICIMAVALYQISHVAQYDSLSNKITLERVPRAELIPTVGHEYTHSVQRRKGVLSSNNYLIFGEGHARGVEKHLAEDYREKEDNEAFLYPSSDRTVGEFKSAYIWMCRKLEQQPRKSLLKIKTSRDRGESLERLIRGEPTSHAIGNALFSIYEALHGRGIYQQLIFSKFQFP